MLSELRVSQLGVIDDLTLLLGPGMTALTGETGAGKTLVVEAIELLLGGKADPLLVRPGAPEATVEGRFLDATGDERVLSRVVPTAGRSRSYLDGHFATSSALGEIGGELVELHGQHVHQSLLSPSTQREALDRYGSIDRGPRDEARRRLRQVEAALAERGGDARSRAHELDLLRYQLEELTTAGLDDPDEEEALLAEESRLAGAGAHREAAEGTHEALSGDGGVLDRLGGAIALLHHHVPLADLRDRLRAVAGELDDVAAEARRAAETFEDNPERLAGIGSRRQQLADLRRKYGDTLTEVIAFRRQAQDRLAELEGWEEAAARLEGDRERAAADLAAAERALAQARLRVAPDLARAVEAELRLLAMPRARFEVQVDGPDGGEVTWLLGANPGEPVLPLTKVASGGELARAMLALRLVLSGLAGETAASGAEPGPDADPPGRTLVFDEVDAGIGGEAAVEVGRALAALGRRYQVVVVTHLPQVAAFADQHVAVTKGEEKGRTRSLARALDGTERVVELSRMLSGQPDSDTARRHAEELLTLPRRGPGEDSPASAPGPVRGPGRPGDEGRGQRTSAGRRRAVR